MHIHFHEDFQMPRLRETPGGTEYRMAMLSPMQRLEKQGERALSWNLPRLNANFGLAHAHPRMPEWCTRPAAQPDGARKRSAEPHTPSLLLLDLGRALLGRASCSVPWVPIQVISGSVPTAADSALRPGAFSASAFSVEGRQPATAFPSHFESNADN